MSAKVKETTLSARETLKVTSSLDTIPMKEVEDGKEIQYCGHVIQEIVNENTGEIFESCTVISADGSQYGTRSESFIIALKEILETIADFSDETDNEPIILKIVKRKSKSGNMFTTCSLV